MEMEAILGSS